MPTITGGDWLFGSADHDTRPRAVLSHSHPSTPMFLPATKDAAPAARSHPKNGRKIQRPAGKSSDPYLEDALRSATALCAELLTDDVATLARAGAMSPSWASDLRRNRGSGSFIHRTTSLVYRLAQSRSARVWVLVAHVKATAKSAIMPMDAADLTDRFWELLDARSGAEARTGAAVMDMARTHDLEGLKRACIAGAAILEEIAAVILEIQRRRVTPFAKGGKG